MRTLFHLRDRLEIKVSYTSSIIGDNHANNVPAAKNWPSRRLSTKRIYNIVKNRA